MYSWDNAQVLLVGNKSDYEEKRVVSTERGEHLGESLGSVLVRKMFLFGGPGLHSVGGVGMGCCMSLPWQ